MTNQQHPAQFDWATELLDAQGHVTLSAKEAHEIGARLRSMGDKLKAYEDLDEAASDVQLLRMGYAAARLEIESLQARIKTMAEEHADELMVAHLDGRMRAAQPAGAQQPTTQPAPQQEVQYNHGPQAETVAEAARDVGKWLNERPNRPIDLRHVAMLCAHAQAQAAQEPVAWYVTGGGRLLDEDEAKAEARRIGGTARAIPLYTVPQTDSQPAPVSANHAALPPLPDPDLRDVGTTPGGVKEFLRGYATEYAKAAIAAHAPADSVMEPAAYSGNLEQELAMLIRRIVSSARRNCEDGSNVLKLANEAWAYLVRKGLNGSPLRDAGIESDPTPPTHAADSVLEDAARWRAWAAGMVEACAAPHGVTPPFMAAFEEAVGDSDASFSVEQLNGWVDAARKQGANHD